MSKPRPGDVTFHLIRHAQSTANAHGNIIGDVHAALTPDGVAQRDKLNRYLERFPLGAGKAYTSDMERALRTAEGLSAAGLGTSTIHRDARLREISRGDWDGKPRSEIYTPALQAEMDLLGMDHCAPGGESMHHVGARMRAWALEALAEARANGWNAIAAVSHGVAIKCLLHRLVGFNEAQVWLTEIDNASITTIRYKGEKTTWALVRTNATPHLEGPF